MCVRARHRAAELALPAEASGAISVHNFHTMLCFPSGSLNSKPVIFGKGFVFLES